MGNKSKSYLKQAIPIVLLGAYTASICYISYAVALRGDELLGVFTGITCGALLLSLIHI